LTNAGWQGILWGERSTQEIGMTDTATLEEIWKLFRETDRKFQDTDRQFQETKEMFQASDRRFQDTERLLKEQMREMSRKMGDLGNRLGEFVEEMVRPAVVRLFRERRLDVHEVHRGVYVRRDGDQLEIDLLVVDTTEMVAVECKSKLEKEDVDRHLERLGKVKRMLPKYGDMRVLGAVAAMVVPEEVGRYAIEKGLFVLGQTGDMVVIQNGAEFAPRVW
jgi:hypothetical protein